jgi:hypothetical protein
MSFSDYIVYVDESGDHSLQSIDPHFPVFSLVFCIFRKSDFVEKAVPVVQRLKFDFWGHDAVVLRGHEIRKQHGDFNILRGANIRAAFIEQLNKAIEGAPFTVIAAVIDKIAHKKKYAEPRDPYDIALVFCMERLFYFLRDLGQGDKTTHVLVECRGAREDAKLELEFRRICDGNNQAAKCQTSIFASWTRSTTPPGCNSQIWSRSRLPAVSSRLTSQTGLMTLSKRNSGGTARAM